ncbi:hypothetical protein FB451DRAFT_1529603 [Mycena latifolia]|nr:hypothetical protein FB451DRAFT_1529603 [Mycena latifolia]
MSTQRGPESRGQRREGMIPSTVYMREWERKRKVKRRTEAGGAEGDEGDGKVGSRDASDAVAEVLERLEVAEDLQCGQGEVVEECEHGRCWKTSGRVAMRSVHPTHDIDVMDIASNCFFAILDNDGALRARKLKRERKAERMRESPKTEVQDRRRSLWQVNSTVEDGGGRKRGMIRSPHEDNRDKLRGRADQAAVCDWRDDVPPCRQRVRRAGGATKRAAGAVFGRFAGAIHVYTWVGDQHKGWESIWGMDEAGDWINRMSKKTSSRGAGTYDKPERCGPDVRKGESKVRAVSGVKLMNSRNGEMAYGKIAHRQPSSKMSGAVWINHKPCVAASLMTYSVGMSDSLNLA